MKKTRLISGASAKNTAMGHGITFRPGLRARKAQAPISPLKDVVKVFADTATANIAEATGQVKICRCSYRLTNVEGQETCDLHVTAGEQTKQTVDVDEQSAVTVSTRQANFLCRVHADVARYRAAGIDPDQVYEGSPYEAQFIARNKEMKLTA